MSNWLEQEAWCQAHQDQIEGILRPMWILWLGCLVEPVVLAVLVYGLGDQLARAVTMDSAFPLTLLRVILIVFTVVLLVASVGLRQYLLRLPAKVPAASARLAPPDSKPLPCGASYRTRVMIPTAMVTAPSVFGFVLFLLGDSPTVFLAFAGAAVVGLLWQRPKRDELIAFCVQRDDARATGSV